MRISTVFRRFAIFLHQLGRMLSKTALLTLHLPAVQVAFELFELFEHDLLYLFRLADDLNELRQHEFAPHRTRRNGVNLIYVKTGANVERLLSFMGAVNAAEEMHAQKAFKQVRNQTNRQTNCDTANLGKTARANAQTLKAIRFLEEQDALSTLPEVLQQAAAKRMQYPDLSLTALCGCFEPAVSKSGLSHRMKKLEALAENLRKNLEQEAQRERDQ